MNNTNKKPHSYERGFLFGAEVIGTLNGAAGLRLVCIKSRCDIHLELKFGILIDRFSTKGRKATFIIHYSSFISEATSLFIKKSARRK